MRSLILLAAFSLAACQQTSPIDPLVRNGSGTIDATYTAPYNNESIDNLSNDIAELSKSCDAGDERDCTKLATAQLEEQERGICRNEIGETISCVEASKDDIARLNKLDKECADVGGAVSGAPVCEESIALEESLEKRGTCRLFKEDGYYFGDCKLSDG